MRIFQRAILIAAALALWAPPAALAQSPVLPYVVKSSKSCPVGDGTGSPASCPMTTSNAPFSYTALGCFQITGLSTAKHLPTVPTGATLISLTVETQSVRMRDDGTAPTASIGLLLPSAGPWPYSGSLTNIQFIEVTPSATIDYCAYK